MIKAIHHITLAVHDVQRAVAFYRDTLSFDVFASWRHGATLHRDTIWLLLRHSAEREGPIRPIFTGSLKPATIAREEIHVAFLVSGEDFGALSERIIDSGATVRQQQTAAGPVLFFADPDGHKLELHVAPMPAESEDDDTIIES